MKDDGETERKKETKKERERYNPVPANAAPEPQALSPLHTAPSSFGRELPKLSGRQEVHHRLVAFFYGKKLRDLHVSASARFPARRLVSEVISSTPLTMRVFTFPDSYKDHVLIHPRIGTHVGDDEHGVDMTIKADRPIPQIVYFVSCQTQWKRDMPETEKNLLRNYSRSKWM